MLTYVRARVHRPRMKECDSCLAPTTPSGRFLVGSVLLTACSEKCKKSLKKIYSEETEASP